MLSLACAAMNYAWGQRGDQSEVASLSKAAGTSIDPDKPYAELWMGTHPSGPSVVRESGEPLRAYLDSNPEVLGEEVRGMFDGDLPFLFKVLSVATALSIQAHPDKELARRLHSEHPEIYKDPNHKPEMALALEDFEALCGFVSIYELRHALNTQPELASCLGPSRIGAVASAATPEEEREAIRGAFTALMTSPIEVYGPAVEKLVSRLESDKQRRPLTNSESLALRLQQQYPGDVGVLATFFLNYLKLEAGEAIYLPANEPHAYVSGQLLEVMATSDNVVRAGLTPKSRDVGTLCGMLTYKQGKPEILRGIPLSDKASRCFDQRRYSPPFDEFQLDRWALGPWDEGRPVANRGPGILLVMSGNASISTTGAGLSDTAPLAASPPAASHIASQQILPFSSSAAEAGPGPKPAAGPGLATAAETARGHVLFVSSGADLTLRAGESGFVGYYASCNDRIFAGDRSRSRSRTGSPVEALAQNLKAHLGIRQGAGGGARVAVEVGVGVAPSAPQGRAREAAVEAPATARS